MSSMQPPEILERAVAAVSEKSGLHCALGDRSYQEKGPEWNLIALFKIGDHSKRVAVEVKPKVHKHELHYMAKLLQREGQGLLIAERLTPSQIQACRELGLWCMDTAGNAYINMPPLFLALTGNYLSQTAKSRQKSIFNAKGLQVIFALLAHPPLLGSSYRDIATLSGVSIGTVTNTIRGLKRLGFIEQSYSERQFKNMKKLLGRWLEGYMEVLRPKYLIGRYTCARPEWLRELPDLENAYWAGEPVADAMGLSMHARRFSLFVRGGNTHVIAKLALRKDPEGEVFLFEAFWNERLLPTQTNRAPFVLTYAELIASGDPRNQEIAEEIHATYLE